VSNRRRFFGSLFAGALAVPTWRSLAASAPPISEEWDLRWVNRLRGEHRQVFDTGGVADGQLRVVRNWLNGHNEVFKLRDNQLVAVVGLASRGFPANASDALWEKYPIGERWQVRDPATNSWATHNVFANATPGTPAHANSVPALVARGVIFWQCNNALRGIAGDIAATAGSTPEAVYQELRAGLLPHVRLVPAHTMLVGLCQEAGCTYEAIV
jgi:hypothetical protein